MATETRKQLEVDAAEIRIRAERRLGEMLQEPDTRAKPGQYQQESSPPTLADMEISRDLSSRAQSIASIPEDEFEVEVIEHWRRCAAEAEEGVPA